MSESLLKTTQARIADIREWEASKERVNYDDDIWWEARRPAPQSSLHFNVVSKLHVPTEAYKQSVRGKHKTEGEVIKSPEGKAKAKAGEAAEVEAGEKVEGEVAELRKSKEGRSSSPPPGITRIDPNSTLLRTTKAYINSTINSPPPPPSPHQPHLATAHSGPQVGSKIFSPTTSAIMHQWKGGKKEAAAASPPSPPRQVKPPSERLLQPNTALLASTRNKAQKEEEDPREKGWNLHNIQKDTIPPLEKVFPSPPSSKSGVRRSLGGGRNGADEVSAHELAEIEKALDKLHAEGVFVRGGNGSASAHSLEEVQRVDTNLSNLTFETREGVPPGH